MRINAVKNLGRILLVSLFLNLAGAPLLYGQETAPPPDPVNRCLGEYSEFREEVPFALPPAGSLSTAGKFKTVFEQTQQRYHSYLECIFNEAAKSILAADTGTDGFWVANTPNIPHLLEPEVACLEADVLNGLLESTAPDALLPYLLKAYNAYSQYLKELQARFLKEFAGTRLEQDYVKAQEAENLITNEIQNSAVAHRTAFVMLTELRQVFTIHVQFQCMLHNLEGYRKFLSEIRKIITLIPNRIIDASLFKR